MSHPVRIPVGTSGNSINWKRPISNFDRNLSHAKVLKYFSQINATAEGGLQGQLIEWGTANDVNKLKTILKIIRIQQPDRIVKAPGQSNPRWQVLQCCVNDNIQTSAKWAGFSRNGFPIFPAHDDTILSVSCVSPRCYLLKKTPCLPELIPMVKFRCRQSLGPAYRQRRSDSAWASSFLLFATLLCTSRKTIFVSSAYILENAYYHRIGHSIIDAPQLTVVKHTYSACSASWNLMVVKIKKWCKRVPSQDITLEFLQGFVQKWTPALRRLCGA